MSTTSSRALHIFDLDGTLLRGSTASLEIARALGASEDLVQLESAFALGHLDTRAFARELGALWRGLDSATVDVAFANAPWIGNIERVVADIHERGEHAALITMSPNFFADLLVRFGIDHTAGSGFPALPLISAPEPERILTPESKVGIADGLLSDYGLSREQCVAYGDSGSDVPLFLALEKTVAINATPALAGISRQRYDGDDLWEAYSAARVLLGR